MTSQPTDPSSSGQATNVVRLSRGEFELALDPQFGGRINSARLGDQQVLLTVRDAANSDAMQAASFPLVPFSNRVADGAFEFRGIAYQLASNWNAEPNAIHGEGWRNPWQITEATDTSCELTLQGTPWWPWAYECKQLTQVHANGFEQTLTLTNQSERDMPAGLGFHPYFPRTSLTTLQFQAGRVWSPISGLDFNSAPVAGLLDFSKARSFGGATIDHCYENWSGTAIIRDADRQMTTHIDVTGAPHCVLFISEGKSFLCLEPVSHISGALNGSGHPNGGLNTLGPGEACSSTMRITASLDE